jgi:hypothetical protein
MSSFLPNVEITSRILHDVYGIQNGFSSTLCFPQVEPISKGCPIAYEIERKIVYVRMNLEQQETGKLNKT